MVSLVLPGLILAHLLVMTTYVLSQHRTCWHVHRYGAHGIVHDLPGSAAKLPTEKEALENALTKARKERPSQVLRVNMRGDSTVIARFGKSARAHH
jgi:hypothetical protein